MPLKPVAGSNLIAAACDGVNEMPLGFAASTAGVRLTNPPVHVPPAGVGGQGTLNTPCNAVGTDVIVNAAIVPSASLPDKTGMVVGPALKGTNALIFKAVGGVLIIGRL